MIIAHKTIEFENQVVFESAVTDAPHSFHFPTSDEACFVYVKEGTHTTLSSQEMVEVAQGHFSLTSRDNLILKTVPNEDSGQHQITVIHFPKKLVSEAFDNHLPTFLAEQQSTLPGGLMTAKPCQLINNYIETIQYYLDTPQLATEEIIKLRIKEILLLLLQSKKAEQVSSLLETLFSDRRVSFKTTVETHLFHDISLSELAHLSHMSLSTFKRNFKKIYQTNPSHYILNQRLEKARKLLELSELSMMEIAERCGFKASSHFSTKFKEKFGISPSQYRLTPIEKKMA